MYIIDLKNIHNIHTKYNELKGYSFPKMWILDLIWPNFGASFLKSQMSHICPPPPILGLDIDRCINNDRSKALDHYCPVPLDLARSVMGDWNIVWEASLIFCFTIDHNVFTIKFQCLQHFFPQFWTKRKSPYLETASQIFCKSRRLSIKRLSCFEPWLKMIMTSMIHGAPL